MRVLRKQWKLLGLALVAAALVLGACAPANNNVDVAEPTDADVGETPPQPEEPTEAPTEEPTEAPTEEPAEPTPTATPEAEANEVALEEVVSGLAAPVALGTPDDGSGRLFIVDQVGQIWIVDENGELLDEPFLDISDRMVDLDEGYDERGLLDIAFHPDYAENGRFFVYYGAPLRAEAPADWSHTNHVSEFTVSEDDPNQADADSEQILLEIDEPQSNHEGGDLSFGPDGYLYIPLGDGGDANDTGLGHTEDLGNAQDLSNILGSILRIDVDEGDPYGIPADNPFVDDDEVPDETWAWGFRNPWRATWDGDRYFVSDAGQNRWEEVNIVEGGQNYGWHIMEGTHCFDPENPDTSPEECPDTGPNGNELILPIIEYANANQESGGVGLVVVGGYVYRGSEIPWLEGNYVFADWSDSFGEPLGELFYATEPEEEGQLWEMHELVVSDTGSNELDLFVLSFGRGPNDELYVLTSETPGPEGDTGTVWRIAPSGEMADTEDDTDGMAVGSDVNAVTVNDQPLGPDSTVNVASVQAMQAGWMVIHADQDGAPGPVIGQAAVDAGDSSDVSVEVDPTGLTQTLYAMLHVDTGTEGEYEFPDADEPATDDEGNVVVQPFNLTGSALGVEDQDLGANNTVNVPLVLAEQAGWMVIHADQDGQPGPVIGWSAVEEGVNTDVSVEIDQAQATPTLYAMLHVDTGTEGEYEFPDADPPAEGAEGEIIVQPFELTNMSAAEDTAAEQVEVMMIDSSFDPAEITVPAGTTVVWTHNGSLPHTVTADDGSFDSGSMSSGDTFEQTFDEPGEYPYYCTFHGGPGGVGMAGVVTVEEGS